MINYVPMLICCGTIVKITKVLQTLMRAQPSHISLATFIIIPNQFGSIYTLVRLHPYKVMSSQVINLNQIKLNNIIHVSWVKYYIMSVYTNYDKTNQLHVSRLGLVQQHIFLNLDKCPYKIWHHMSNASTYIKHVDPWFCMV